jgi:hypothetical protein
MISAPEGLCAVYDDEHGSKDHLWDSRHHRTQIVAFNDDGEPLVPGKRELELARRYKNFLGIISTRDPDASDVRIMSVIPGDGWYVEWSEEVWERTDGNVTGRQKVICWALRADGEIVPIVDGEVPGRAMQAEDMNGKYVLWHPDHYPDEKK